MILIGANVTAMLSSHIMSISHFLPSQCGINHNGRKGCDAGDFQEVFQAQGIVEPGGLVLISRCRIFL